MTDFLDLTVSGAPIWTKRPRDNTDDSPSPKRPRSLCAICLDTVSPTEMKTCQQCSVVLHHACAKTWCMRSPTCPQCRTPMSASKVVRRCRNCKQVGHNIRTCPHPRATRRVRRCSTCRAHGVEQQHPGDRRRCPLYEAEQREERQVMGTWFVEY